MNYLHLITELMLLSGQEEKKEEKKKKTVSDRADSYTSESGLKANHKRKEMIWRRRLKAKNSL